MSEIKISFKNYKLLKEGEFNLSDGTIFFVQGPNNVGKTSFLNLLRSIMEVKDDTQNPVTFGEKEGFATGTLIGADGKSYQFRYDFNIEGKNKFIFIDENNKVIKTIGEMRAIFNYTHFTVEEFFDWSKSVPGRKKQREIFLKLLNDKEREEIEKIDLMVNTTNGELMESRKEVNRTVDFLKKRIDATIITPEQYKLYKSKDSIDKLFDDLTKEKKEHETLLASTEVIETKIEAQKNAYQQLTDYHINRVNNLAKEIDDLKALLSKREAELDTQQKDYAKQQEEHNTLMADLTSKVDIENISKTRAELETVNERLAVGENKRKEILRLSSIIESLDKDKKEYEEKKVEAESYDEKIKKLRERKKEIIFSSQNIPAGWSLDDDSVTIDSVPFMETDLSKSKATKAIAKLMMKVNDAPIMLMGDAESLGYEVLNELEKEAKEHNKIMVFAEHLRDAQEIKLVCYDETEIDNNNTDLF